MKTLPLLILVALFHLPLLSAEKKLYKDVTVDEFDKLRAEKNTVVLDVRTPEEFASGHIPGATNINWNAPDFAKKAEALDKEKTYLVHCAAGGRSAKAAEKMSGLKFQKVYNLEDGFKSWRKAGKPVEK